MRAHPRPVKAFEGGESAQCLRALAVRPNLPVQDERVQRALGAVTGTFGPGLPQSTPAGPAGGVGLAPVNDRAFSLASPAGRGRIPAADSELPEVRARGTAPALNAGRRTAGGGPGKPMP